ncbi:Cyclic AMP receptor protein [bacterium HR40]|nr:Cyclic AMP receptor protein [bacterium HR40]
MSEIAAGSRGERELVAAAGSPVVGTEGLPEFARRLGLDARDFALMRRVALFHGLSERQLERLCAHAGVRRWPRGSLLFVQGDPADRMFVVLEGWVRLARTTQEGQEVTIHIFGPGESIAEAAVFQMGHYPVTATAVEDARLLVVPAESLLGRLREDPDLCFNLVASLARRLHGFVQQIEQLSTRSTSERLALFLCRLCGVRAGSCTIRLPLDKTLIAARLGMQPETLSRSLAKLREVGVETRGAVVMVHDVAALRRYAHMDEE